MWHVNTDSDGNESKYTDENEWDSSNEDEEYMEPIRNDSGHGLGYA